MRLHILSDLHLESGLYKPEPTSADVVVLAGDIHMGCAGLEWIRQHFAGRPVVYITGNHEFYKYSMPALIETMKSETIGSSIHVLENNAVEIDGITILGCTLWTDFRLMGDQDTSMLVADQGMNDFYLIKSTQRRLFRPWESVKLFEKSVGWLKSELAKHDPARTVIVTHHAPSHRSIAPFQAGGSLSPAFASDLDDFIRKSGVPLWIHGHTHYNVDYKIGKTRIYSNQHGYAKGVLACFDPGAIVKI